MPGSDEMTRFPPHRLPEKRRTHCRRVAVRLLFCAATLLSACSGIKTYENSLDKNLHVHTATDSGSWFSRVRAAVDIHRVGEDCALDYEGTVQLTGPATEIGMPQNRRSYLVFVFSSSSFFPNRSGTITYETLINPRPHHHYDTAVTHKNDMYNVVIREIPTDRSAGRELDRLMLSACRSSSDRK
jgi:hypothetical protein